MNTDKIYAGVDVSKAKLDVSRRGWKKARCFANNAAGIAELFAALDGDEHIVCEATGGYEKQLMKAAWAAGRQISRVDPGRVRSFAHAAGQLAKTDPIDAALIRSFAEAFGPSALPEPAADHDKLVAASRRRESLARRLAKARTALGRETDPYARNDINVEVNFLRGRLGMLEAHIDKLIAADAELTAKRRRAMQVKGVGPVCSQAVLAEIPELGSLTDKQASALAGLAPFNRDSGKTTGRRSVRGGRGRLRRALYMPAMSAARHNAVLKEFYERLLAKGKPHHVAIVAVMRKLICLLNRMIGDPGFELS